MRYSGIEKLDARLRAARKRTRYDLVHQETAAECSSDPRDYIMYPNSHKFEGYTLVKREHPYITRTGLMVFAPLVLKYEPTKRDLVRLAQAKENL